MPACKTLFKKSSPLPVEAPASNADSAEPVGPEGEPIGPPECEDVEGCKVYILNGAALG